jgi:uncharacterized protein YutE (UPF0331/DUF86 family)
VPRKIIYNVERIGSIVSDIERYLEDLGELNISTQKDLNDKRNFYAVSMVLFTLLNRVFDLGNEVSIAHNMGIPSTYREIFTLLRKNGCISDNLSHEMIGLVTYRNLLSHEYHGIDEEKLFLLTTKIGTIREFVDQMQKKIRESD